MGEYSNRWYVAISQAGKDQIAERHLGVRGYVVYRPKLPARRKTRWGFVELTEKSMFPRYLFVQPHSQGWEMLRCAPGILYGENALMRINAQLVSIADNDPDFIEIQETERRKRIESCGRPPPPFAVGDEVRIHKEPWLDFLATIENIDDERRVVCLISMMRRKVRTEVDSRFVSLANP